METLEITQEKVLTPDHIVQIGSSFWASRTVLAAVKLGLFTYLGDDTRSGENIRRHLNLHPRSLYDFLDALVSLGFLQRKGIKETAVYSNTPETAFFLDKNKPSYMGGILEMCNDRLYRFWADLDEALITGKPQNEAKYTGKSLFDAVYAEPDRLKQFLNAMAGIQMGNFMVLADRFDFQNYDSLCDIGGASAMLAISVARKHPHLAITSADLPVVAPVAEENISRHGLEDQIQVANVDFMTDSFPKADIITMGNILHDWDLEIKKLLIRKAYEALPPNGAFIVIESIIDNERRTNSAGLLMSLNMLIETDGGFDYSYADFKEWVSEAGFRSTAKMPLTGPTSAVIAYK